MYLCLVEEHGRILGKASPAADCLVQLLYFDAYYASSLAGAENHPTGSLGENGVVGADARVGARAEASATLAHDDSAGLDHLAAEGLYAKTLSVRIAAVPGTAAAFFVSHLYPSCVAFLA
jgi:hypothetical protein